MAENLKEERLIKSSLFLKLALSISGKDKEVRYGEYLFSKKESLRSIVDTITKGNFYYRKIFIPECTTIETILKIIDENEFLSGYIEKKPIEGSLFPETYFFLRNEDKNKIINRMQNKMKKVVNTIWIEDSSIIKSKDQLIKLGSIIEAEASLKEEKYLISGVFHNRMKKNMKLQSDPTVLYAKNLNKKVKTRKLYKKDLISDNPWNTYTRVGLPMTAICNPGYESLKAAMVPRKSDYLYFVANGDGGHRFSSNFKQHLHNIKLWKKKISDENEK